MVAVKPWLSTPVSSAPEVPEIQRCEAAVTRLAVDRRYFRRPTRSLFGEVRTLFAIGDQLFVVDLENRQRQHVLPVLHQAIVMPVIKSNVAQIVTVVRTVRETAGVARNTDVPRITTTFTTSPGWWE